MYLFFFLIQTAVVLWTMLLADRFPMVHEFIEFLQEKKPVRVINRDQWQSFLEFAASDIANYDESSACKLSNLYYFFNL